MTDERHLDPTPHREMERRRAILHDMMKGEGLVQDGSIDKLVDFIEPDMTEFDDTKFVTGCDNDLPADNGSMERMHRAPQAMLPVNRQ